MKTSYNRKSNTFSITGLTASQYNMIEHCTRSIRENMEYDSDMECFVLQSDNVVISYDEEELNTLKSIIL